jgi:small subunit ribosomal protein S11
LVQEEGHHHNQHNFGSRKKEVGIIMGKKRIAEKTEEELIKEAEKLGKREIKIKTRKKVSEGKIYIFSSYNNTIITLTDMKGNVVYWTSAGKVGFSGTKKGTPYAASKAAEEAAEAAKQIGFEKVEVLIKGIGSGRESALRTLGAKGLNIVAIKDITPIPFDGPRPPKVRRV